MPFITEEIWQALYDGKPPVKSIALTVYPQPETITHDGNALTSMFIMQEMIIAIRGLRKDLAVPEKEFTPIQIFFTSDTGKRAEANTTMLSKLARVASVEVSSAPLSGTNARSTPIFDVAVVYERQIDVAAERERLSKELAKYEKVMLSSEKQLGNEAFLAKAPQNVVDGLKKQQAEMKLLYDKTKAALDAL